MDDGGIFSSGARAVFVVVSVHDFLDCRSEVVTCTPLYRPKYFIGAYRTKLMYVLALEQNYYLLL